MTWAIVMTSFCFLVPGAKGMGHIEWNAGIFPNPRAVLLSGHAEGGTPLTASEILPGKIMASSGGVLPNKGSSETPAIRTRFSLVNTAMALLATFDGVDVLPPEGSSQANQIIHAVIQIQSALVKSRNPDLQKFVSEAIQHQVGNDWETMYRGLREKGLSSRILEAILTYSPQPALWETPSLVNAFQEFNVTEGDWRIVEAIFFRTKNVYSKKGSSIHKAYESWRAKMS